LGTGGVGARRLHVLAVGGAGRRAHLGVGAATGVPSCAIGIWNGAVGHTRGGQTVGRRRGQVDSRATTRSEGRPGGERSGTHVGARQPGSGEVRRDARGPDGRAAVRSGGQSGDGEVRRMVGHTRGG
jgi:hypothetical protein